MAQTPKYIVSCKDFTNELLVAGLENGFGGATQELSKMICKYEPIYLSALLGYAMYQDLLANIQDPSNVPQDYADLVNGVEYTNHHGILTYWEGLRKHTAQHIYYWYQRNNVSSTTVAGQVKPAVENGQVLTNVQKFTRAYNSSIEAKHTLREYMQTKSFAAWNESHCKHHLLTGYMNGYGV